VFPNSDSIKEHHWILFRIAEHRIPIKYANIVPRGPLSYARVVFFQPTYTPLHIVKHNTHPNEQRLNIEEWHKKPGLFPSKKSLSS